LDTVPVTLQCPHHTKHLSLVHTVPRDTAMPTSHKTPFTYAHSTTWHCNAHITQNTSLTQNYTTLQQIVVTWQLHKLSKYILKPNLRACCGKEKSSANYGQLNNKAQIHSGLHSVLHRTATISFCNVSILVLHCAVYWLQWDAKCTCANFHALPCSSAHKQHKTFRSIRTNIDELKNKSLPFSL
jgi:hypothetical protein